MSSSQPSISMTVSISTSIATAKSHSLVLCPISTSVSIHKVPGPSFGGLSIRKVLTVLNHISIRNIYAVTGVCRPRTKHILVGVSQPSNHISTIIKITRWSTPNQIPLLSQCRTILVKGMIYGVEVPLSLLRFSTVSDACLHILHFTIR